jgi:superoxide dismutase, Cu-Zn family
MKNLILMTMVTGALIFAPAYHSGVCGQSMETQMKAPETGDINKAVCVLYPASGSTVSGIVTFTRTDQGIKVVADISGLTPGKHGFHIHEYGDCSAPDAMSAGGHFNPAMQKHGGPMDMERHEGDMGNIIADDKGVAHLEITDKMMSFEGKNSIIGRGVIVHAKEDDLVSQPVGNAGARVACGTIAIAK